MQHWNAREFLKNIKRLDAVKFRRFEKSAMTVMLLMFEIKNTDYWLTYGKKDWIFIAILKGEVKSMFK